MIDLTRSYRKAVQRRTKLEPAEWCKKHVRLFRSTDANSYRPEYTPWWTEPMREIRDNDNKVICITTPVGSGKSTMVEAMACNILAGDPGPMLITGQTNEDVRDWAETGLWPTLAACEPLHTRLPSARGRWRKMELIMPRSPVHLTGANLSGLQSKSERWVIGDEVWMWRKGMLAEKLNRLHKRWNGRAVLLGQAGFVQYDEGEAIIGDDFALLHSKGEQREWCLKCPQCSDIQPFKIDQMKYPDEGTPAERAKACVYECENCSTQWDDTSKSRRMLVDGARYERMKEATLPGHISFHLNALALWRSPWVDVVMEYLSAQESMKSGLSVPLQQFTQKQLAEPWDEAMTIDRPDMDFVDTSGGDYAGGEKIDGEVMRFATIDAGKWHYWLGIRAWRADASSVGIYYSRVNTEEMLLRLIKDRGVLPHHTYIDSGYDTARVYDMCAKYGWVAIKGDQAMGYNHLGQDGVKVLRLMSKRKSISSPCGKRVPLIHLAVDPIKGILSRLRSGDGARWQAVPDIGEDWITQIDSEEREEFIHPKTKQPTVRWVRKRRHNHSWDVEVYQVAAALIWRIFPS